MAAFGQQNKPKAENPLPLKPIQRAFLFTEGKREGEKLQLRLERIKKGNVWQLQLGDLIVAEIFSDQQGDLRLLQINDPKENTVITYEPAILLIPATIHPNVDVGQRVQATVIDLKTREISHQAMVSHRLKSIVQTYFYTPAGKYEGYQVQIEQEGSFGMTMLKADFYGGFTRLWTSACLSIIYPQQTFILW